MDRLPSNEFRKTYPRLSEPVAVTVLGRVIGHYVPISTAIDDRFVAGLRPGEPVVGGAHMPPGPDRPLTSRAQQANRDAILRKINSRPK